MVLRTSRGRVSPVATKHICVSGAHFMKPSDEQVAKSTGYRFSTQMWQSPLLRTNTSTQMSSRYSIFVRLTARPTLSGNIHPKRSISAYGEMIHNSSHKSLLRNLAVMQLLPESSTHWMTRFDSISSDVVTLYAVNKNHATPHRTIIARPIQTCIFRFITRMLLQSQKCSHILSKQSRTPEILAPNFAPFGIMHCECILTE